MSIVRDGHTGARRVLLLGGTGEARQLAELLAHEIHSPSEALKGCGFHAGGGAGRGVGVVYSIAGRVRTPGLPVGVAVRVGGFGGGAGLASYLRDARIDTVVDATHPFAATMTGNAVQACAATGVPLLVLRRPGWTEVDGDDWRRVPSLDAAVDELAAHGRSNMGRSVLGRSVQGPSVQGPRVFLTTGRSDLALFARLDGYWFLVRSVDPPVPPLPAQLKVVLDRGPFTVDGEVELMRRHRIDILVTKDSGGAMTAAKLVAARQLGLPVVMVDRPALPPGLEVATTVDSALAWIYNM